MVLESLSVSFPEKFKFMLLKLREAGLEYHSLRYDSLHHVMLHIIVVILQHMVFHEGMQVYILLI